MKDKNKSTTKSDTKVLVIEGDFINSFMLKQFLDDDFKMLYARDSHEVVKIMNEHFVDVVLLNTEYDSFGLSATDLVKYIKNKDIGNQIKIVALSNQENGIIKHNLDYDASLTHPYTKDEVIENIGKLLKD
jgi:response regulator RpfG family c-di-GMP phosphodiesterase